MRRNAAPSEPQAPRKWVFEPMPGHFVISGLMLTLGAGVGGYTGMIIMILPTLFVLSETIHREHKHKGKPGTASPRASKRAGSFAVRMNHFVRVKHDD